LAKDVVYSTSRDRKKIAAIKLPIINKKTRETNIKKGFERIRSPAEVKIVG